MVKKISKPVHAQFHWQQLRLYQNTKSNFINYKHRLAGKAAEGLAAVVGWNCQLVLIVILFIVLFQKKIQTGGVVFVEDYFFKNPRRDSFYRLVVTLPLEISGKTKFDPWEFHKIVTHLKIPTSKTSRLLEIPRFFLDHSHPVTPLEFPHQTCQVATYCFNKPENSMSSTFFFSEITYFTFSRQGCRICTYLNIHAIVPQLIVFYKAFYRYYLAVKNVGAIKRKKGQRRKNFSHIFIKILRCLLFWNIKLG